VVTDEAEMLKHDDKYRFWLFWLTITFIYIIIRINIIDIPLDRDEGIFGYAGQQILNGGIPYRDVFDHKPPVTYYLYAFALLFVPPTATGIHIFLHLYNYLTLISVYLLAKRVTESTTTGLWAAFAYAVFSSSPEIQGFSASSEMFMLLPITLCLLFAVLAMKRNSLLLLFSSGTMGALACWTKQTAIFSVFFVIVYIVTERVLLNSCNCRKLHEHVARSLLFWAAGGIGISVLIMAYFYENHLFDEFVYWSFTHSFIYSKAASIPNKTWEIYKMIALVFRGNFMLFLAGILMCLRSIAKREKYGVFFLGFLLFSIIGTIPGYVYNHYFAQIAPAIALIGGFGVSNMMAMTKKGRARLIGAALITILVMGVPLVTYANYYYKKSPDWNSHALLGDINAFPESRKIASYISARTNPNDSVYIFGSEAQILLYAHRKSATSFALIYPLLFATPRHKEFQLKAWKEIINNSPKYIILNNSGVSTYWDGKADLAFAEKIQTLIDEQYYQEAIMFITGEEKGRLVILPAPVDHDIRAMPKILIYRRKVT